MKPWLAASLTVLLVAAVPQAKAGAVLDRIKQEGILRCAATERPGYATIENDQPAGRVADLCRAMAKTVLGTSGRFALRLLDLDSDFDRVRNGEIELSFLEPRVAKEQKLENSLKTVAEAYRDSFAVMVPQQTVAQSLSDLKGRTICFMIGDPVWPLLDSDLQARHVPFRPFGFSEEVEMKDAYNVGRCGAMAGVASTLEELRGDQGVNHLQSRLIEERLGLDPVIAMVPRDDPEWAAAVEYTLDQK